MKKLQLLIIALALGAVFILAPFAAYGLYVLLDVLGVDQGWSTHWRL